MGARYYNATEGRFISPDPFGHAASMDLYSFANGDPVNFVDPTGRKSESGRGDGVISSPVLVSVEKSGNFINADPIGFAGGMNWFAYASGNPFSRIDPQGTADGGSTIGGSSFGANPLSGAFSQGQVDDFNANGRFNTGPTIMIRDNYSHHIPAITSLIVGGPGLIKAGFSGLKNVGGAGRSLVNLLANGPTRNTIVRTGTMQFDDALIATTRMVEASSSSSATIGREILMKTAAAGGVMEGVESGFSFLNGLNGNSPNPMAPSAFDLLPNNLLLGPVSNLSDLSQSVGFGLNQSFGGE